jgi:hypothetical protein
MGAQGDGLPAAGCGRFTHRSVVVNSLHRLLLQMVVVLDCRGGSSMGLGRHMGLLKKLAVTLNQHYPDRLYRLHLLELPLLLRWVMHGITPLLHPNTRSKVVFSSMTDPGLPVTVAHLSKT